MPTESYIDHPDVRPDVVEQARREYSKLKEGDFFDGENLNGLELFEVIDPQPRSINFRPLATHVQQLVTMFAVRIPLL